jgi:cytochrome c-type biogenesis protein CcmH
MLFWIFCAVLTAGVVLALIRPLTRGSAPQADQSRTAELEVYKDQLREIDNDIARGVMSPSEAEPVRREVSRRVLALADAQTAAGTATTKAPLEVVTYAIAAGVPVLALAMYVALGSPGLPAHPSSERTIAPTVASPIGDLIARIEERLRDHPEDGQGWDVIAPVYLRLERYDDAARAYERAMAILGESPKRLSGWAEANVTAANGIVADDVRKAFQRMLELEPGRPDARFWLAMAKEQDGDTSAAAADYRALLSDTPIDAPWRMMIEQRLAALKSAETDARSANEEQRRMIDSMVSGLRDRLHKDGSDVAGWRRLLQSYTVLGRREDATSALGEARVALSGNAAALAEVEAFAQSLGIGSGEAVETPQAGKAK